MISQFDVSQAPQGERFSLWQQQIAHAYQRSSERCRGEPIFNASMVRNHISWLEVSEISCDPATYRRGHEANGATDEYFSAAVMLEGVGQLSQAGRHATQRPGDIVIYDTARAFTYFFETPYRMLLVRVPRQAMLTRFPKASQYTSIVLPNDVPTTALFTATARNVVSVDLGPQVGSGRLAAAALDVLIACIEEGFALKHNTDASSGNALATRAQRYLLAHIEDNELTLDTIAAALHVSKRTLNRAFSDEGASAIRWLWEKRLTLSRRRLAEGNYSSMTELAFSCGFANAAHFSRAFKGAFQKSPSEFLDECNTHRVTGDSISSFNQRRHLAKTQ